jgi:RNA polymerase sigma factor (sigma-70 family)
VSSDEPDIDLLARCRNGDAAAWRVLVHRYERLVYTVGRRAGLDDHGTADLFQTVFARLVEHLPRLRDGSKLQAWIVTTAKREVLLLWRRGQRTVSLTPDSDDDSDAPAFDMADDSPIAEAALEELQQVEAVRRALARPADIGVPRRRRGRPRLRRSRPPPGHAHGQRRPHAGPVSGQTARPGQMKPCISGALGCSVQSHS